MRSIRLLGITSIFAFTCGCLAQDVADATARQHTNTIVVEDPLPWLDALLQDPGVQAEVRGGSVGDLLKLYLGEASPDTRRWLRVLRSNAHVIPARVTLSFPPESGAKVVQVSRLFLAMMLADATFLLDDDGLAARRRLELQEEVLRSLTDLASLQLQLHLRCRDEAAAEDCADAMLGFADALAREVPFVRVDHRADGARIAIVPGDGFRREQFVALLDETPLIDGPDDPAIDRYWRWLREASFGIELLQRGKDLRIQVGEGPAAAAPAGAAPPAVPELGQARPFLRGAADLRPFAAAVAELQGLWQKWGATEVAKIAQQHDTDRAIDDIVQFARQAATLPLSFAWAAGWSDDELVWAARSAIATPADLRGHPIAGLVPEGVAAYSLDATTQPAELLFDAMQRFEGSLSRMTLGRDDQAAERAERLLAAWFERVTPLRDLLSGPAMQSWRPPMAVVVQSGAPARIKGDGGDAMNLIVPGVAMITATTGPAGGMPFARRLLTALAEALQQPIDDGSLDRDLGLGVPTLAMPAHSPGAAITCDEQCLLHAFATGDLLVLSTSVATSKAILARAAAATPWVPIASDTPVVATAATTGARLGVVVARIGELMARIDCIDRPREAGGGLVAATVVGSALAGLLAQFGPITSTTRAVGGNLVTEGSARFASRIAATNPAQLLAKVRERLGPWPADAAALVAEGACRYIDLDGRFSFLCAADGRFLNHIDNLSPEWNCWNGTEGWGTCDGPVPHPMGDFDLHRLRTMTRLLSGHWIEPAPWDELRFSPDTLPGEGPTLLWQLRERPVVVRLQLDPATLLPRSLDWEGWSLLADAHPFQLGDYRPVLGHQLPHRIASDDATYTVERWNPLQQVDAATMRRPALGDDATFAGPAEAELQRSDRSGLLVRVHSGTGSVWLGIDRLCERSDLTPSAAAALGIRGEVGQWTLPAELRIGPVTLKNQRLFLVPEPKEPARDDEPRCGGQIGYSLFARCCAELDLAAGKLELYPPGHFVGSQAAFVPLVQGARSVIVDVQLDQDTRAPFHLAFGQGLPLAIGDTSALGAAPLAGQELREYGMFSARWSVLSTAWRSPKIGATSLGTQKCFVPANRAPWSGPRGANYFGYDLLTKGFRLLLDVPGNRAAFVPR